MIYYVTKAGESRLSELAEILDAEITVKPREKK